MLKKIVALLMLFLAVGGANSYAKGGFLNLQVGIVDGKPTQHGNPKSPMEIPTVWQDGYEVEIEAPHAEYVLNIVSGTTIVYSVVVPANVSVIYLPATLTGTFELQLYDGGEYYFYSEIEL